MEFKTLVAEEKNDSWEYTDRYNTLKFDREFDEKEVESLVKEYDRYTAYIDDGDTYRRKNEDNAEIVAKLLKMGCVLYILKDTEDFNGRKFDWVIINKK
jgi:hypothetical protein